MKLKRVESLDRYKEISEIFRRKGCISNDYLQGDASGLIAERHLFEYVEGGNAFLLVEKDEFFRLYYYLNDLETVASFDNENIVTEILFRGDLTTIASEVAYLERCGLERHLVRDQYFARYTDLVAVADFKSTTSVEGIVVKEAGTLAEVQWACELFNSVFDKWSGDFLPESRYAALLQGRGILLATDPEGRLLGSLHQTREKGMAWVSHVAVLAEARGRGVGKALLGSFIERNHTDDKSRYMLWVQRQNEAAVRMYQQKGFKPMGKSSLSMLKLG